MMDVGPGIHSKTVSAAKNVPFRMTYSATGGLAPITWSRVDGRTPHGIHLNYSNGEVYGSPYMSGVYAYSLHFYISSYANSISYLNPLCTTSQCNCTK